MALLCMYTCFSIVRKKYGTLPNDCRKQKIGERKRIVGKMKWIMGEGCKNWSRPTHAHATVNLIMHTITTHYTHRLRHTDYPWAGEVEPWKSLLLFSPLPQRVPWPGDPNLPLGCISHSMWLPPSSDHQWRRVAFVWYQFFWQGQGRYEDRWRVQNFSTPPVPWVSEWL